MTGGMVKVCEYHERSHWSRVIFVDTLWKLWKHAMCLQSIRPRSNVPNIAIASSADMLAMSIG